MNLFRRWLVNEMNRAARIPQRPTRGFSALVQADDRPFVGQLTFVRVYSGNSVAVKGRTVYNQSAAEGRIGRIVQMHANNRQEIEEIALQRLRASRRQNVTTGETLCGQPQVITLEHTSSPGR